MSQSKKKAGRALVWFRNDLRIRDNKSLLRASQEFEEVFPLFIFDENLLKKTYFRSNRIGSRRLAFILESLQSLHWELKSLGAGLHVEIGNPIEILDRITKEKNIQAIFAQKEIPTEEVVLEKEIHTQLGDSVRLNFSWGKTLFHLDDLPMPLDDLPDVFTSFRKNCEKNAHVRSLLPIPKRLVWRENIELNLPTLSELGFTKQSFDKRTAFEFKGGELHAQQRLKNYFFETQNLSNYKRTRNGMIGSNYSSKFSPWLAFGNISSRQIYFGVKKYEEEFESNSSTYWMIFELIWRDYFAFVMQKFGSKIFRKQGIKESLEDKQDHNLFRLAQWKKGETGIPFVDANMRELNLTGYMSNRGRQNAASFLVKDLQVDWRCGAAYFEEQLIDYDCASNWGNWAYVAGVGNDPRENRYFNIMLQAERYDPNGEYVKLWIPELRELSEEYIHMPWKLDHAEKKRLGIDATPFSKPIFIPKEWEL